MSITSFFEHCNMQNDLPVDATPLSCNNGHFAFNAFINNLVGNTPIAAEDTDGLKAVFAAQIKLVVSEFNELCVALLEHDVKEIRDGINDVIVTSDGMLHRLGSGNYYFSQTLHGRESSHDIIDRVSKHLLQLGADNYLETVTQDPFWTMTVCGIMVGIISDMHSLAAEFELDIAAEQQAVYESNLSKFDTDTAVAEAGMKKYQAMGVEVVLVPREIEGKSYYIIKSAKDQVVAGKDYPKGKFLKSVNFKEPAFSALPASNPLMQMAAEGLTRKAAEQEQAAA